MDIAIFDAALSYAADPDDIKSITIVELKRPQRNDYVKEEKDPIDQVYEYVMDIKAGKVKRGKGRSFGNVKDVAFYCYIIADITPTLERRANKANLQLTQDGEGYFGYNSSVGAYIEIISYNKLVKDAKQRNRVLFDKLFTPKASNLVHAEFLAELNYKTNRNYSCKWVTLNEWQLSHDRIDLIMSQFQYFREWLQKLLMLR